MYGGCWKCSMMVGNSEYFIEVLDYAGELLLLGGDDMDDFRGHDADGGQVLELTLHNVEMIVERPGHVVHDLRDF